MKQEKETFTADAPWMHLTPSLGPCSSNVQSRNIWGSALSLQRFTEPKLWHGARSFEPSTQTNYARTPRSGISNKLTLLMEANTATTGAKETLVCIKLRKTLSMIHFNTLLPKRWLWEENPYKHKKMPPHADASLLNPDSVVINTFFSDLCALMCDGFYLVFKRLIKRERMILLIHVKGYPPDNTGISEGQHYVTQNSTAGVPSILQRKTCQTHTHTNTEYCSALGTHSVDS